MGTSGPLTDPAADTNISINNTHSEQVRCRVPGAATQSYKEKENQRFRGRET